MPCQVKNSMELKNDLKQSVQGKREVINTHYGLINSVRNVVFTLQLCFLKPFMSSFFLFLLYCVLTKWWRLNITNGQQVLEWKDGGLHGDPFFPEETIYELGLASRF